MRTRTVIAVSMALATALLVAGVGACARGEDPVVVAPQAPSAPETPTAPPVKPAPNLGSLEIELDPVVSGLDQPLLATGSGDGSGDIYLAKKAGELLVLREDAEPELLLDLTASVTTESERGLLGVAFPERFGQHGRFYVSYTDRDGASVVSRFTMADGSVELAGERVIIRVPQPYANHNGGNIAFGPDGYLYTSFGDGGSGGDPLGSGQDTSTLLGAMLRVDVGEGPDGDEALGSLPYAVPPDNPFVGEEGVLDEIWSYGLRNPWRFSFDRQTGDLWIADVGQNAVEEVNFQPAGSGGGENWGWNLFEGTAPHPPDREITEDLDRFAWPIVEYRHPIGRSVTGGYVYRGDAYPQMRGVYLYGDFVTGRIWGLVRDGAGPPENRELLETGLAVVSFGETDEGEVLVVDFGGTVYRVTAR